MNQKYYSVVLSAVLVCFVQASVIDDTYTTTTEYYDSSNLPKDCEVVCRNSNYEEEESHEFISLANARSNLIAFYNRSAKVGLILDIENVIVFLVNVDELRGVLINVEQRSGAYVTTNDLKIQNSLREYFFSLKYGLEPLLTQENAVRFQVGNAPSKIREAANEVLENLIFGFSELSKNNPKPGIEVASSIGSELIRLYQGPLKGLVELLGNRETILRPDLIRSINVLVGLATVYGRVPGGIPALLRAGVKIDLQKIADAQNGIDLLTILIRQISSVTNAGKILGDLLNEPEPFFKLLRLLSGNQNVGVNGAAKVASVLVEFAENNASLENVINVIIQFLYYTSEAQIGSEEIAREGRRSLTNLIKAIERAECAESLSGARRIAEAYRSRQLVINDVNVSAILRRLTLALDSPRDLAILINVLQDLEETIKIEESLPRLLVVLIVNINSPLGINLLRGVGLQIDININTGSEEILQNLLRSVSNIERVIDGDLYGGLCSVPVIKKIISGLDSSISECGVKKQLKDLLEEDQNIKILIKAVLQVKGGLQLEVPDETCSEVRERLQRCSSNKFYLNIGF